MPLPFSIQAKEQEPCLRAKGRRLAGTQHRGGLYGYRRQDIWHQVIGSGAGGSRKVKAHVNRAEPKPALER
jgi:hypothetical protein